MVFFFLVQRIFISHAATPSKQNLKRNLLPNIMQAPTIKYHKKLGTHMTETITITDVINANSYGFICTMPYYKRKQIRDLARQAVGYKRPSALMPL